MKRYFTPYEANSTLPFVREVVKDILKTGNEIRGLSEEPGGDFEQHPKFEECMSMMNRFFKELEAVGCSYRDWNFDMGLVDFPSYIDGREVFLCWRSDEPGLCYYHDLSSGYAGRKPIPADLLEKEEVGAEQQGVLSDA